MMKKLIRITFIISIIGIGFAQIGCQKNPLPHLTIQQNKFAIEDSVINSTDTLSVDIIPVQPGTKTAVIIRNNRISAINSNKHIILLGNEESGAYVDRRGVGGNLPDQDLRRGPGEAARVVVLGHPVARVAQPLRRSG